MWRRPSVVSGGKKITKPNKNGQGFVEANIGFSLPYHSGNTVSADTLSPVGYRHFPT